MPMLPFAAVEPFAPPSWTTSKKSSTPASMTWPSKPRWSRRPSSPRVRQPDLLQARGHAAGVQLQAARAYNKIVHLTPAQRKRGVICASAGNHAQGVAMSAQKLGLRAVIVMPTTTPAIKVDAVKKRGAEVVLFGDSYDAAYAPRIGTGEEAEAQLRPPLRRSLCDRRAGHHRHGNPAPASGADRRGVLLRRRRRPDLRGSGLHQAPAAGNQSDRRRGGGRRRHGPFAQGGPPACAWNRSASSPTARR
jgi:hypothetical protein